MIDQDYLGRVQVAMRKDQRIVMRLINKRELSEDDEFNLEMARDRLRAFANHIVTIAMQ